MGPLNAFGCFMVIFGTFCYFLYFIVTTVLSAYNVIETANVHLMPDEITTNDPEEPHHDHPICLLVGLCPGSLAVKDSSRLYYTKLLAVRQA